MKKLLLGLMLCIPFSVLQADIQPQKDNSQKALHFAKGTGSAALALANAYVVYCLLYQECYINNRLLIETQDNKTKGDIAERVIKSAITVALAGGLTYSNYKLFIPWAYKNFKEAVSEE